jgi:hypothetical protein
VARAQTSWDGHPLAFTVDEVEVMSRLEHDRWWRERAREGWTLAPEKDVARKRTPYLVPYEDLPEPIKEYDRNAVRAIPELLEGVGFAVARLDQEAVP